MKIQAAVLKEKSGKFVFEEVELGEPAPDEVLVRVVASGICHTDAHVRLHPEGSKLPLILGHEGSGVVEKVGSGVQSLRPRRLIRKVKSLTIASILSQTNE